VDCFASLAYDILTQQQDLLERTRDERDALERQNEVLEAEVAAEPTITADPIPRPSNVKNLKIDTLRGMMGLAGETHKEDWNRLRVVPLTSVLDCCSRRPFLGSGTKNHGGRTDRLGPHFQGTAATKTLHALCRGRSNAALRLLGNDVHYLSRSNRGYQR
jgi:hypothetical protein